MATEELLLRGTLVVASLGLVMLPVWCWVSRFNVWAISATVPIFIAGYGIPLLMDPQLLSGETWEGELPLFAALGVTGLASCFAGIAFSSHCSRRVVMPVPVRRGANWLSRDPEKFENLLRKRSAILLVLVIAGLIISFAFRGNIPLFADDQMAAKYAKNPSNYGQYKKIAAVYRSSILIYSVVMPLNIFFAFKNLSLPRIALIALAFLLMLGTLFKSQAVFPVLIGLGFVASSHSRSWLTWLAVLCIATVGGAITNEAIHLIQSGGNLNQSSLSDHSFGHSVSQGAPDITDTLRFLSRFDPDQHATFGKTFVGGMVPFQYKWNPAIYSLSIAFYGDLRDIDTHTLKSGGFRMLSPIWGFAAFGWLGAALVPFISGFLFKSIFHEVRSVLSGIKNRAFSLYCILLGSYTADLLGNLHLMSIYRLTALAIVFAIGLPPLVVWRFRKLTL
ncbi:hypothetical protein RBSH_04908 [Rhodopirellula baltica SH28]|uniref:Oligosaccharide repeat unit polymerase n=1 Tax=Rhodopirellula baltica SH28 TaxID=993517 RepID=K5C9L0_RHOBT|nr:hypothetical protein [Rhodopirellula baltica]EKJ99824.1 hypothetical protein RBSH_04908 [Rhodopirellula baltica SH28]